MSTEPVANASFSSSQKEWLDGFLKAAIHFGDSPEGGTPSPYPAEAAAGYRAQTRWLAEGKRLSREEEIKRRRNPHLFRARLAELDAQGAFPEGEENFLARFHGIFNVAPTQERPMTRLRIPCGILTSYQALAIAQTAKECADGNIWFTTRSNLQIRQILPGHMSELLVRLEEVGLGARGSGADNIRNVVGNPTAGIDPQELLDVRPLCRAWHHHILHTPDLHGLPRKFNVAFDGGNSIAALEDTNDIGLRACRLQGHSEHPDGVYLSLALGGITGHCDFARPLGVLLSLEEWLPACDAILRAFLELGNRGQRGKARLKYVLDALGHDGFLQKVQERLPFALRHVEDKYCQWAKPVGRTQHLGIWPQKQDGLFWMGVHVPIGKMQADTFARVAHLAQKWGDGHIRLTVWQNFLLSGIPQANLASVRQELAELGLTCTPDPIAQGLIACTGSEACKHGQAATKKTALEIENRVKGVVPEDAPVNIHLTGCAHSCAQHYIGDIGLLGTGVERDGVRHDAFHVLVGGGSGNLSGCARPLFSSVLANEIPHLIQAMLQRWLELREPSESFLDFVRKRNDAELTTTFASLRQA